MTQAADTLVFLYKTIRDKEDDLNTLECQLTDHANHGKELSLQKEVVLKELDRLKGVVPVVKDINDDGG